MENYRNTNETRGSGDMKFLAILDYNHTSVEDMAKKGQAYEEEKKKHPDKYPETLFPMHSMYKGKTGFAVWEADEAQITRKVAFMLPEVHYTLIPIMDPSEGMKIYMEVKK
jgi:hypothetical protein